MSNKNEVTYLALSSGNRLVHQNPQKGMLPPTSRIKLPHKTIHLQSDIDSTLKTASIL